MTIQLNAQPAKAVHTAIKAQTGTSNPLRQPFRVIIVEDMEVLAEMMSVTLEFMGCQVQVAHRRSKAMQMLSAPDQVPDLVLLDIDLPDGNGFDICAWLRQQPALGEVPVVFCTGRASGETEARAVALNAGTLFKPFSMDVLAELAKTYQCQQRGEIPTGTSSE